MALDLRSVLSKSLAGHNPDVCVHVRPEQVQSFIDEVRLTADLEREALGFLPAPAYESAARTGHLLVATQRRDGKQRLVGHLLFGGAFPHARVHQLHVVREARGFGIAKGLVNSLIRITEQHGYMDVTAKVAADLPANAVWERLGFEIVRKQPGGSARNRTINVRVRQLNTPTLFGYPENSPVTGLPILDRGLRGYTPVYAIDLNVLFDVVKKRPRAEYASQVIGAALDNVVRLVVAEEFTSELRRSFKPSSPDPIYEFALQLPSIHRPSASELTALASDLASMVFPERSKAGTLSIQDNSDLVHLATAIHHSASGFITAEDAIVRATDPIETRYGLQVIHVAKFAELLDAAKHRVSAIESRFAGRDLRLSELTEALRTDLVSIIDNIQFGSDLRQHLLAHGVHAAHQRSIAVSLSGRLVCAALWNQSARLHDRFSATVISDEDQPAIESALDALLLAIAQEATINGPVLINLTIPNAHTITREMAIEVGFTEKTSVAVGAGSFQRMALGSLVAQENWPSLCRQLSTKTGNTFSEQLPDFHHVDQSIQFSTQDGTSHRISIENLESALYPALICSPRRKTVLVPIRRAFADHLLNTSRQISLLPTDAAALFHQRVYYSSTRNSKLFSPGTILVFYESGRDHGRSAAIALARVRETAIVLESVS